LGNWLAPWKWLGEPYVMHDLFLAASPSSSLI
jgi:hypothetical protein